MFFLLGKASLSRFWPLPFLGNGPGWGCKKKESLLAVS
jgi:hypothetical protein